MPKKLLKIDNYFLDMIKGHTEPTTTSFIRLACTYSTYEIEMSLAKLIEHDLIEKVRDLPNEQFNGVAYISKPEKINRRDYRHRK